MINIRMGMVHGLASDRHRKRVAWVDGRMRLLEVRWLIILVSYQWVHLVIVYKIDVSKFFAHSLADPHLNSIVGKDHLLHSS